MLDKTMRDRLLKVCEREFTAHVDMMFKIDRFTSTDGCAHIPFFDNEIYGVAADTAWLRERVVAALLARRRFAWEAPPGMPVLPLSMEALNVMVDDPDPWRCVAGLFGTSLRGVGWDCDLHPPFARYVAGLMAFPHTPCAVRFDSYLRERFPPMQLDGLVDDDWCWRPPEKIAEDRQFYAWGKDMTAQREKGLPHQAFDDEWRRAHPVSTYAGE